MGGSRTMCMMSESGHERLARAQMEQDTPQLGEGGRRLRALE